MSQAVSFHYDIDGENFSIAGEASSNAKKLLKQCGLPPDLIRRVVVAMYEGEINMVIHANGGTADLTLGDGNITVILKDNGPGIADIDLAMQEGYSTAPDSARDLGFGAGMGLPNMKKHSDEMHIETVLGQGTTVTLRFAIP